MGRSFTPVQRAGKLPGDTLSVPYGTDSKDILEIQPEFVEGKDALIVGTSLTLLLPTN
jgi:hypothetical protein